MEGSNPLLKPECFLSHEALLVDLVFVLIFVRGKKGREAIDT